MTNCNKLVKISKTPV